jgi:hypothetical protein
VSSIQNAMSVMGYVRMATFADDACRSCRRAEPCSSGLRCMKGFFYVSPAGSCNEFQPKPAVPADQAGDKVRVGPSNI